MLRDSEAQRVASDELDPDEHLAWVGQPNAARQRKSRWRVFCFGLLLIWVAYLIARAAWDIPQGVNAWAVGTFSAVFLLFGLIAMAAPHIAYQCAKSTIYAITDRRILTIRTDSPKTVVSYEPVDIGDVKMTVQADGSGDIVVAERACFVDSRSFYALGFKFDGVADVRLVEDMIRQTFKRV